MGADGTFSPVEPRKSRPMGPGCNTGQKSTLTAPLIDTCTAVLDSDQAKAWARKKPLTEILRDLFHTGTSIAVGPLQDRQLYMGFPRSATLVDETGSVCGKIGVADDGRIVINLTGQGCQHVPYWPAVADNLDNIGAHLSRVDIAVDDLTGETFDIHHFKNLHAEGAFMLNGRPPTASFVDDLGSGKGCSLYVGQKGHKQLNVYEKGKQLGDPESGHTRCELRLYAKRIDLPNDALRNPGKYFGAAYPILAQYVIGEIERLGLKEQIADMSWRAMKKFLRTQAGTSLQFVLDLLGDDALQFIQKEIARQGRPGRFKRFAGDPRELLRKQLLSQSISEAA